MAAIDSLAASPEAAAPKRSRSMRRMLRHPGFLLGAGILVLMTVMAIAAPLLALYDPYDQDLNHRVALPVFLGGDWAHPFGTDALGRDYWSRLVYGARISLFIGLSVVAISGAIGTALGIAAGYFGGKVDLAIRYLLTVRLSLPVVLVALAVVAMVGGSLTVVVLVLGLLKWDRFTVVLRTATQQVGRLDYVTAAKASGASVPRILATEILPNVAGGLIVVATTEAASAILVEAALSFLGLGVQPPLPSWGLMIAEAKAHIFFSPWLISIPGLALLILVLAINLLGDGLRDVLAPEQRI